MEALVSLERIFLPLTLFAMVSAGLLGFHLPDALYKQIEGPLFFVVAILVVANTTETRSRQAWWRLFAFSVALVLVSGVFWSAHQLTAW